MMGLVKLSALKFNLYHAPTSQDARRPLDAESNTSHNA